MGLSNHKIQIANLKSFTLFDISLIPNICSLWISFGVKFNCLKMACYYHNWP
jgi:hypothetical protein